MITSKKTHHGRGGLSIATLTIFLAACGGGGQSDSGRQPSGGAGNVAPVASIAASPTTPVVGQSVSFNPGASFDADGSISNYQWDFGDGQTQLVQTNALVNHAYAATGSYTVTLSVFDNGGKTNSISLPIQVGLVPNVAPVASFTTSSTTAVIGQTITFNPSASSDADGTIVDYAWRFGDGVTQTSSINTAVTHSFSAVGTFTVSLTVTDNRGGNQTVVQPIIVGLAPNVAPVASFITSSLKPGGFKVEVQH